jgi:hypothetical protein
MTWTFVGASGNRSTRPGRLASISLQEMAFATSWEL